jgi:hypothetical protein
MLVRRLLRRPSTWLVLGLAALAVFAFTRRLTVGARPPAPGLRLVYELDHVSASSADLTRLLGEGETGQGLKRAAHVHVAGRLEVTELGGAGGRARFAYRLLEPVVRVAVDGELDLERSAAARAALERPILVEADDRGRLLALHLGDEPEAAVNLARAILSATQVVRGPDGQAAWEVEEDGPSGTYLTRYEAGAEGGLRKRRLRRKEAAPAAGELTSPREQPEGELTGRLDERGRLLSLEGTEGLTTTIAGRIIARTETALKLRLLSEEQVPEADRQVLLAEAEARGAGRQPLALAADGKASERALQRSELGTAGADSLLADLARAERAAKGSVDETALYLKFKALVYLEPGVSGRLGRRLLEAPAEGVALRVLSQALASSGEPAAQEALAAVVRARQTDWPVMAELLPALGAARAPNEAIESVLRELARTAGNADVRTTAQLALGALGRNLAATSPARAGAIVRTALADLAAARTPGDRRQALLVLGNTGAPEVLAAARPYLVAPEPEVRSAAVAALRWMPGPEVDALLLRALKEDEDQGTRLEALTALELRPATSAVVAGLREAARADRVVTARLAALALLARWREAYPEAEAALREAANDPVAEVRSAAAELLAGGA